MKLHTKQLTLAALTAAAYAVLSYFGSIFGITYGPIQCRFSEALCVLPFFLPETAWGLGVGCLIANLLSPYGVLDIVVGSAATLLAALLTARCQKKWLAPLPPVIANTVLIGLVLAYEQAGTSAAFWPTYAFNALTVGLGEAVACYGLGGLLWHPRGIVVSVMVTQRAVDCNRPGVHFRSGEARLRQKALRKGRLA